MLYPITRKKKIEKLIPHCPWDYDLFNDTEKARR